jgi:hypothetical protein
MKSLNISLLTIFAVCSAQAPSAFADVTLHQNVTVSASGVMSMMGSKGTVTTVISGDRARTENQMESTSSMMKKFAKNVNTATIVSLDEERMLNLVPEKKQYSEITFEQLRAQMEKSMAELEKMQESMQGQGALPVSEEDCQWSEPQLLVDNTHEKQEFAGIKAEQTIISASQTCTVPNTGKSCEMTWNMEFWNAKRMPGGKEALEFQQGMARAMGGDEVLGMAQVYTRGLLAMFKKGWEDVLTESGKMEGYPIKTVMSLEMGGASCTTGAGQPIAMDDVWSQAADASMNAATSSAAGQTSSAIGNATAGAVGNGIGGSIAGSAIGAASREVVSGMFKKFRKNKNKSEPVAETANTADTTPGFVTIFEIATELTGIDDKKVSNDLFKVPEGWKKVSSDTF